MGEESNQISNPAPSSSAFIFCGFFCRCKTSSRRIKKGGYLYSATSNDFWSNPQKETCKRLGFLHMNQTRNPSTRVAPSCTAANKKQSQKFGYNIEKKKKRKRKKRKKNKQKRYAPVPQLLVPQKFVTKRFSSHHTVLVETSPLALGHIPPIILCSLTSHHDAASIASLCSPIGVGMRRNGGSTLGGSPSDSNRWLGASRTLPREPLMIWPVSTRS